MATEWRIDLQPVGEAPLCPTLLEQWRVLLTRQSESPEQQLYRAPEWFDYFRRVEPESPLLLASVHGEGGGLSGLAPLRRGAYQLSYHIGTRRLAGDRLRCLALMGGEPLWPAEPAAYELLLRALRQRLDADADALYLSSVRVGSLFWNYLRECSLGRLGYCLYVPDGQRLRRSIAIGDSLDAYLAGFGAKTRNTLRRKLRRADERGLRMFRAEHPEQVGEWLEGAARVHGRSWQARRLGAMIRDDADQRRQLELLAAAGLLRSYLLYQGDEPCAFVLGRQHGAVFHYAEVGYDPARAGHSPSVVLLLRIIQDLNRHRPAQLLDLGLGEQDYKRQFGNRSYYDAPVLLLRSSLHNRVRSWAHGGFRHAVRRARHWHERLKAASAL